ncbi:unnamed protein product [Somion occarium]|uniref:DUF6534 domain-containing protein n=1 Tax=Somion occarium TaxID=3059160 RepID=A0ABP1DEW0_9APHY
MADDPSTIGALLIGALVSLFLSGVVSMQSIVYYQVYRSDRQMIKCLVTAIWILDLAHSGFLCGTDWIYLVLNRTNVDPVAEISWTVIVSVALTATMSFLVHSFYTHRLWMLSNGNLYLIVPIASLNLLRIAAGYASSAEMARKDTWDTFFHTTGWLFTLGLVTSSVLDLVVGLSLILLLRRNRTGFQNMDQVIRTLTLFTIETGMLTSVAMIAALVCWLSMPDNLIFLALYFTICHLYANAFLATLNARKAIQQRSRASSSSLRPTPHVIDIVNHQVSRGETSSARDTMQSGSSRQGFLASLQKALRRNTDELKPPDRTLLYSTPAAPAALHTM